jgi:hypothetical protein
MWPLHLPIEFVIWLSRYTVYSILAIVFLLLVVVTSFITIVLTYFQLAAGANIGIACAVPVPAGSTQRWLRAYVWRTLCLRRGSPLVVAIGLQWRGNGRVSPSAPIRARTVFAKTIVCCRQMRPRYSALGAV